MRIDIGEDKDSIEWVDVGDNFYVERGMLNYMNRCREQEEVEKQKKYEIYKEELRRKQEQKEKSYVYTFYFIIIVLFLLALKEVALW